MFHHFKYILTIIFLPKNHKLKWNYYVQNIRFWFNYICRWTKGIEYVDISTYSKHTNLAILLVVSAQRYNYRDGQVMSTLVGHCFATVATSPVVLRWLCDSPRTGCAWRITPYIYVARTSNNRVIMACELYCCLLSQCEALRICRSGFPIATPLSAKGHVKIKHFSKWHYWTSFKMIFLTLSKDRSYM